MKYTKGEVIEVKHGPTRRTFRAEVMADTDTDRATVLPVRVMDEPRHELCEGAEVALSFAEITVMARGEGEAEPVERRTKKK